MSRRRRWTGATLAALLATAPLLAIADTPEAVGAPPPPQETAGGLQQRTILSPQGSFTAEPSLSYSQSTSTLVAIDGVTILPAIAVGLISVRQTQRESLTAALGLRYGLTDRLEVETRIPYVYREEQVREREVLQASDTAGVVESTGYGLGDVEASLRYQLSSGRGDGVIFTGGLRMKSRTGRDPFEVETTEIPLDDSDGDGPNVSIYTEQPTGSGFYAVQPSLNWVYPSEPAVLYGSLSYLYNVPRTVTLRSGDRVRIEPGSAIGVSFGMGLSLNDHTSLSLGYDHTTVQRTRTDVQNPDPEFGRFQVGSLLLGASHRLGPRSSLGLSVGVGVTEQAPDVQVTLRLPVRF
ncbi:hypothetical protein [Halorhodospira halophila]|uniref:hypothetical protein n=1 Tax=Halorhodospira halophila TaxID=1053 RepID=UPI0019130273|nr:hypothetical protein [Halorhodospira halophila]MBK5943045.1 hypothetical protein [Halorhodospira halophila]